MSGDKFKIGTEEFSVNTLFYMVDTEEGTASARAILAGFDKDTLIEIVMGVLGAWADALSALERDDFEGTQ